MIPDDNTTAPARTLRFWQRFETFNPALVRGLVLAIGGIAVIWGFDTFTPWGDKVIQTWEIFYPAAFLLQAWWTRSAVTPAARVVESVDENGVVIAGPASPRPTGEVLRVADPK